MERYLQGVWQLSKWSVEDRETERELLPYKGDVEGYLVYSPQGWVSASLMNRRRAPVCEDRIHLRELCAEVPTDPNAMQQVWEWFLAGFGYVAYCGRYEVVDNAVHHHLLTSLIPQWVGTTLVRDITWFDDFKELHLTAAPDRMVDKLQWRRIAD
ncbi:MAG: lipocalin-like domain-containing protein [Pseudomonadota bacterium]